jgi:DNA-binding transcriptional ArsR family regulator
MLLSLKTGIKAAGAKNLAFNDDKVKGAAFLAKSLSDTNRLKILLLVCEKPRSVSSIVESLGISQPLVSHHLKELRRCLLVCVERKGPFVYYRLSDQRILDALRILGDVASGLLTSEKHSKR